MAAQLKKQDWRFLFAGAVLVSSAIVMWEWLTGAEATLARSGGIVTMKPLASYLFALIATAQMLSIFGKHTAARCIATSIFLWMPSLIIAGYDMGFVVPFADDSVLSVGRGIPSLGAALSFLILSLAMFKPSRGWFVAVRVIAVVALAGYALERFLGVIEAPLLYWYLPSISTAMALPTAVLLLLLSFARHA